MNHLTGIKTAIIHDWLVGMRGGESVLEAIVELFPDSDLFTLVCDRSRISNSLSKLKIKTSLLQKFPRIQKGYYRYFLPVFPKLIEGFDLTNYDLIISSSHCVAKGIRKAPHAVHVSYVHAPMRYMWDRYDDYFGKNRSNFLVRSYAGRLKGALRRWDQEVSTPDRIDRLVTNSYFIAEQVRRFYDRGATVVFPFVRFEKMSLPRNPKDFYLIVSGFAPNKRIDLAIDAFNSLNLPLVIVGEGQEEKRLRRCARSNIRFLGWQTDESVAKLYSECRAFIFPGIEDFGIAPLEAMAAGAPVVAFGKGGALETVVPETGVFFDLQNRESLMEVIQKIESKELTWNEKDCRNRARMFSRSRFLKEFSSQVRLAWSEAGKTEELFRPALFSAQEVNV